MICESIVHCCGFYVIFHLLMFVIVKYFILKNPISFNKGSPSPIKILFRFLLNLCISLTDISAKKYS